MKEIYSKKARKGLNDKGFSLIELIISIAIIAILMLPLMSSFIRSIQMNKKSEKYQVQTNLAASIMEGLKASTTQEIIDQFNGSVDLFTIIPNSIPGSIGEIMRLEPYGIDEYKKMEVNSDDEQATDYFAIHKAIAGGSAYDVFIRLDAATDEYKRDSDDLNNFPIPEIINLDEKANGLFFSNGSSVYQYNEPNLDDVVLNSLAEQGKAHADALFYSDQDYLDYQTFFDFWLVERNEAEMRGEAPPDPPIRPDIEWPEYVDYNKYSKKDYIKEHITKTMKITVEDNIITYYIEYICSWWAPIDISYRIDRVEYASNVENIYFFYTESIFHDAHSIGEDFSADRIEIINKNADNKIKFFIADQNNTMDSPLQIEGPADDSVQVFTDVTNYEVNAGIAPINTGLINTYELNRIFDITINICKAEDEQSNRYKEVYYSLKSTKER